MRCAFWGLLSRFVVLFVLFVLVSAGSRLVGGFQKLFSPGQPHLRVKQHSDAVSMSAVFSVGCSLVCGCMCVCGVCLGGRGWGSGMGRDGCVNEGVRFCPLSRDLRFEPSGFLLYCISIVRI